MSSVNRESVPDPSYVVRARWPETIDSPDTTSFREVTDQAAIGEYLTDAANFPGGESPRMVEFFGDAGPDEIAHVLRDCSERGESVVIQAARTSLSGGTVPQGDTIINLARLTNKPEVTKTDEGYFTTVKPGTTVEALPKGLFLSSAPTYELATVVGAISTNAAGARSYKYGATRKNVMALKVIRPSGELLEMQRGQYLAHPATAEYPGGYFVLQSADGREETIVPLPTYKLPDVPKVSAGYYSQPGKTDEPGMDLIDLFVGSEGTLGVIAEATVRLMEEPPTYMSLIPCASDKQAFQVMEKLRALEPDKRDTLEPGGVSAVEYMGAAAVGLIRDKGHLKQRQAEAIEGAGAVLLVQVEGDDSMEAAAEIYEECGVDLGSVVFAEPEDSARKEEFIGIREAVPLTVNEQIAAFKQCDPGITKVAADPCVQPKNIPRMMALYQYWFGEADLEFYSWGHGEGNIHINILPHSADEAESAQDLVLWVGTQVIEKLGGTGSAEHGPGKNRVKKELVKRQYGNRWHDMIAVKRAFDPRGLLNPDNILTVT